ncbi:MAG TPA: hypothetical protein DD381_04620 [Lentisphaeria bacterium]|nr:MAG: hypothetical protein A2X47_07030 [Lentisphaerae bacterium GWF2_38_69]HBM15615.1 hypothetical protein [Lentisphaeria bacterium]
MRRPKIVDKTKKRTNFDFLGYTFKKIHQRIRRFPCKKSLRKYKDKIHMETRRCNGNSLNQIIETLKPISRGWFEYYKHSIKNIFRELDSWNRMRLRSILRKRSGRKGRSRCLNDHKKWPNKFFEGMGLHPLEKAYNFHRQPISSNS